MKIRTLLADPRFIARDNEGGGDGSGSPGEGGDAGADDTGAGDGGGGEGGGDPGKTFTQEEVNQIVVKRNKKVREQLEQTEKRYEQLLESKNLTSKEKEELKGELESVQSQLRTKEQQAAYEKKRREQEYNQKLEEKDSEAKRYRTLFETQTRDNAILSAASQHDAYNPEQFISVLAPRTEVVPETNEQGEETGRFVPRVKVERKTEDGTVAEVQVSPAEAIEDMKNDIEKYGNLFRGNVAKGIGQGSNNKFVGDSRADVRKMTDEEYFANRDQIAKQYGINNKPRF